MEFFLYVKCLDPWVIVSTMQPTPIVSVIDLEHPMTNVNAVRCELWSLMQLLVFKSEMDRRITSVRLKSYVEINYNESENDK